jgi:hypothetical protein
MVDSFSAKDYNSFIQQVKILKSKNPAELGDTQKKVLSIFNDGKFKKADFDFISNLCGDDGFSEKDLKIAANLDNNKNDLTQEEVDYLSALSAKYKPSKSSNAKEEANKIFSAVKDLYDVSDGKRGKEIAGTSSRKELTESIAKNKQPITINDESVSIPTDDMTIQIEKAKTDRSGGKHQTYNYTIYNQNGKNIWAHKSKTPNQLDIDAESYKKNQDGMYETSIPMQTEKESGETVKGVKVYDLNSGVFRECVKTTDPTKPTRYIAKRNVTSDGKVTKNKDEFFYDAAHKKMINTNSAEYKKLKVEERKKLQADLVSTVANVPEDQFAPEKLKKLGIKNTELANGFIKEYKNFCKTQYDKELKSTSSSKSEDKPFLDETSYSPSPDRGRFTDDPMGGRTMIISPMMINNKEEGIATYGHEMVHAFKKYYITKNFSGKNMELEEFFRNLDKNDEEKLCEYTGLNIQETYGQNGTNAKANTFGAILLGEDPTYYQKD